MLKTIAKTKIIWYNKILDLYTDNDWREEPLDSDEVDRLVKHLKNQLELINGNITKEEYIKLEEV